MAATAMSSEQKFTVAELQSLLRYDAQTGKLYWLPRDESLFKNRQQAAMFKTQFEGREAFAAIGHNGYRIGVLCGVPVVSHRVAWAIHYGKHLTQQVDHINGDRSDNRAENLRAVSHAENHTNRAKPKNNSSGAIGVCWVGSKNKWQAQIMVHKKSIMLGRFDAFEDAVAARKAAEVKYGFHPNHGRVAA